MRTAAVNVLSNFSAEKTGSSRWAGPQQPSRASRKLFPRAARLLRRQDYDRVYQKGRRNFGAHLTLFSLPRDSGGARVGLTVGRALGGAVQRNRIKRRVREAVRLHYASLPPGLDVVINPKKSVLRMDFKDVCDQVSRAFETVREKSSGGRARL